MKATNDTSRITEIILKAKEKAKRESGNEPEPGLTTRVEWPVSCTVGPGLEGAIACETDIGYVNGSKGWLIYRGYDVFDLCAHSTFEEVSYLLLYGKLPTARRLDRFKKELIADRHVPETNRLLMGFPVEGMSTMSALRLGTNLMRQKQTYRDDERTRNPEKAIATDEDSIPLEMRPTGEERAIYEFAPHHYKPPKRPAGRKLRGSEGLASAGHLIAGVASITATIARIRAGHMPLEPREDLSHAANFLYMMTGRVPTPVEERIMDVCLILHADHGMNASTFATLVVASTLSDIYFSVGSGIAALNGPLHGGANEEVLRTLERIGSPEGVDAWFAKMSTKKSKIVGFGHRVYKAYDPRARVLAPLARMVSGRSAESRNHYATARALEKVVTQSLGKEKKVFTNVDFFSGLVYSGLGIPREMFTPIFAVSRVSGWTARVLEYLEQNRIFRPRAIYTGSFDREYTPLAGR